jgi:predicted transcriptional regulator
MAQQPRSVRLSSAVGERLDAYVREVGGSSSSVIERLLDEALRREQHPEVTFRDGPAGRRAGLVRGPDVWEVVGSLKAHRDESPEVSAEDMLNLLEQSTGLTRRDLRAALRYYAEFTDEIDAWIASNEAIAERLEALWRREQVLLAGSA